ncbi:MAG: type II toxin-antitoxin system VapC family toxin [Verrucomicrobiota bacterium]
MLFDTDIFIFAQRGCTNSAKAIINDPEPSLSIVTYMEFMQGAKDKKQLQLNKDFLTRQTFEIVDLTKSIGQRSKLYIEEYALSHGIRAIDALIASTAVEHGCALVTTNTKHYKMIKDLKLKLIKPRH